MREKKIIYKVPNGKLLKISLREKDGVIEDIKITGDFFAYPEEAIEKLEKILKNAPLNQSKLKTLIDNFINENKIELYGVDVDSLVKVISEL